MPLNKKRENTEERKKEVTIDGSDKLAHMLDVDEGSYIFLHWISLHSVNMYDRIDAKKLT